MDLHLFRSIEDFLYEKHIIFFLDRHLALNGFVILLHLIMIGHYIMIIGIILYEKLG